MAGSSAQILRPAWVRLLPMHCGGFGEVTVNARIESKSKPNAPDKI